MCYWMQQQARCLAQQKHTKTRRVSYSTYRGCRYAVYLLLGNTHIWLCNFLTLRLDCKKNNNKVKKKKSGCFLKNLWKFCLTLGPAMTPAPITHTHIKNKKKHTSWLLLSKPVPSLTFRTPPSFLGPLGARGGVEYQVRVFSKAW